jgi:DnaJ-class molecular chaperone
MVTSTLAPDAPSRVDEQARRVHHHVDGRPTRVQEYASTRVRTVVTCTDCGGTGVLPALEYLPPDYTRTAQAGLTCARCKGKGEVK